MLFKAARYLFVQEVHGNRWSLVAMHIPGRTGQQCAQRWRHKVGLRSELMILSSRGEQQPRLSTAVAEL